jgi:hypothetical protein
MINHVYYNTEDTFGIDDKNCEAEWAIVFADEGHIVLDTNCSPRMTLKRARQFAAMIIRTCVFVEAQKAVRK